MEKEQRFYESMRERSTHGKSSKLANLPLSTRGFGFHARAIGVSRRLWTRSNEEQLEATRRNLYFKNVTYVMLFAKRERKVSSSETAANRRRRNEAIPWEIDNSRRDDKIITQPSYVTPNWVDQWYIELDSLSTIYLRQRREKEKQRKEKKREEGKCGGRRKKN